MKTPETGFWQKIRFLKGEKACNCYAPGISPQRREERQENKGGGLHLIVAGTNPAAGEADAYFYGQLGAHLRPQLPVADVFRPFCQVRM